MCPTESSAAVLQNDGHPEPESHFAEESNKTLPQHAHANTPSHLPQFSAEVMAGSVSPRRKTPRRRGFHVLGFLIFSSSTSSSSSWPLLPSSLAKHMVLVGCGQCRPFFAEKANRHTKASLATTNWRSPATMKTQARAALLAFGHLGASTMMVDCILPHALSGRAISRQSTATNLCAKVGLLEEEVCVWDRVRHL